MGPYTDNGYHADEPPTIWGAICNVFFAILYAFGSNLKAVLDNLTVDVVVYLSCVVLVWLGVSNIWKWLCATRNLKRTKAYVNCVNGWKGMARALNDMWLISAIGRLVYTVLMILGFILSASQFLFWGVYAVVGSLICELGTYTEAQLEEQAPVAPRVVENHGAEPPGFSSAMHAMGAMPLAGTAAVGVPVYAPVNAQPQAQAQAQSRPVASAQPLTVQAAAPSAVVDPDLLAHIMYLWQQTMAQGQVQAPPLPQPVSDHLSTAAVKAISEAMRLKATAGNTTKLQGARLTGRRSGRNVGEGGAAMDVEQEGSGDAAGDVDMSGVGSD